MDVMCVMCTVGGLDVMCDVRCVLQGFSDVLYCVR
jgi:hypothetical protein